LPQPHLLRAGSLWLRTTATELCSDFFVLMQLDPVHTDVRLRLRMIGRPKRWAAALMLLISAPVLPQDAPRGGEEKAPTTFSWWEATPLGRSGSEPILYLPEKESQPPTLAAGRWIVCAGGSDVATSCEVHLLERSEPLPSDGEPLEERVAVQGTVFIGRFPADKASIGVIPATLAARRPFSVPLELEEDKLVREVPTDADGSFTLPPLVPGDWKLSITLPGGRFELTEAFTLPSAQTLLPPDSPADVVAIWNVGELRFDEGSRLEVQVVDEHGMPLPGAVVGASQGKSAQTTVFFEAQTDDNGLALLRGLDPVMPVHVSCGAAGYERSGQGFEIPPPDWLCSLQPLAGVSGTVLDDSEEPLSGATVRLAALERSVRTGEAGDYEMADLPAGDYRLEISAPGFRVEVFEVSLVAGDRRTLEPVSLFPGEQLVGQVVQEHAEQPVAGASVTQVGPPAADTALTGDDGHFELLVDPSESLRVQVKAKGFPPTEQEIQEDAWRQGEPVRLILRPGGEIEILAWDEELDTPCSGCEFHIAGQRTFRLETDATGRALSEVLAPGRYSVQRSLARSEGPVVRVRSGDTARWVTVKPSKTTTVRFGEPSSELRLAFRPPLPQGWIVSAQGPGWLRRPEKQPSGWWALRRRPGEAVRLSVSDRTGREIVTGDIPASFEADRFDIELPESQVVGHLLREDAPLAGERIHVIDAVDGGVRATVRSDPEGRFGVPFLPPGTYRLIVADQVAHVFSLSTASQLDLREIQLP